VAKESTKLMTAEEFRDWLARPTRLNREFELIRGKLVEKPIDGRLHGLVCANVGGVLWLYAHRRNRGYVCTNK
jgi:Uma2 family endonuclease